MSLSKDYRFNYCTHTKEKGYAILAPLLGKFYKSVMEGYTQKEKMIVKLFYNYALW
ncbi:MAG: hypothetical protein ACOC6D_08205 [Atribacterota bacterium]